MILNLSFQIIFEIIRNSNYLKQTDLKTRMTKLNSSLLKLKTITKEINIIKSTFYVLIILQTLSSSVYVVRSFNLGMIIN